jgi:hypothetical protein
VLGPPPRIVVFQYNPESITRSLSHQVAQGTDESGLEFDTLRVSGNPQETMDLQIELDAADQLERPRENAVTVELGLSPAISALELLMYPNSVEVIRRRLRLKAGEVQISSLEVPIALLIWGRSRVVPIRVSSLSITEQAFDLSLNPTRAEVSMSVEVLSYENMPFLSVGGIASLADHVRKETLSALNTVDNVGDFLGLLPSRP